MTDDAHLTRLELYEAHDRIEALTAELDEYRRLATITELVARECKIQEARAEKAEADNARLRKLLTEAAADLTAYVDAEYPLDTYAEYPHIAKRHHRDMELVRHIQAALNTGREVSHE